MANPGYLKMRSNFYVPLRDGPTRAFRSSQHSPPKGQPTDSGGVQYMLSVMLGVTSGRGNSVAEVLSYLRRSAAADGTHPKGTIYYCENGDIRSRVRQGGFPRAVRALKELGVGAEIVDGHPALARERRARAHDRRRLRSSGRSAAARSCPAPSANTSPASAAS